MDEGDSNAFAAARRELVDALLHQGILKDPAVAAALREIPRHRFLPEALEERAYEDTPLHIGESQTISAPHMVAIMLEALRLGPGMRVLEVGTGSGYHAALLAHLVGPAGIVHTIERIPVLAERAVANLDAAGYGGRVHVHVGDGSLGLEQEAPFDRIHVAAAAPETPRALLTQLAPDGILLIPVGSQNTQDLLRYENGPNGPVMESLGPVAFVPLVGAQGWNS